MRVEERLGIEIEEGEATIRAPNSEGLWELWDEALPILELYLRQRKVWVLRTRIEGCRWELVIPMERREGGYDLWEIIAGIEKLWEGVIGNRDVVAMAEDWPSIVGGWVREIRHWGDRSYTNQRLEIGPLGIHSAEQIELWEDHIEAKLDDHLRDIGIQGTVAARSNGRYPRRRWAHLTTEYDRWELREYLEAWLVDQGAVIKED